MTFPALDSFMADPRVPLPLVWHVYAFLRDQLDLEEVRAVKTWWVAEQLTRQLGRTIYRPHVSQHITELVQWGYVAEYAGDKQQGRHLRLLFRAKVSQRPAA